MPDAAALAAAATFVESQLRESPFRGLAEAELVDRLHVIERLEGGILVGAACECARRLADLAGCEPPAFPAPPWPALGLLGDRSLAIFLLNRAAELGVATGSRHGPDAQLLEIAAARLLATDPLVAPRGLRQAAATQHPD